MNYLPSVTDKNLPSNIHTCDRIVAGAYEDYLFAALDERAVIAVTIPGSANLPPDQIKHQSVVVP